MTLSIVIVESGGLPITEAANGFGMPVSVAANGFGIPVTIVLSGGTPVIGSNGGGGGSFLTSDSGILLTSDSGTGLLAA